METAGQYFDRGYHVYLEFKVYRFPEHPVLGKKKYRVDILATKGNNRLLIEVGYLTNDKLEDLKRLCPNCKIIRVLQWKNFSIRPKFNINGYTCEVKGISERKSNHKWLPSELAIIQSLIADGKTYREIANYFPYLSVQSVTGLIFRLYRQGKLNAKPSCNSWTKQDRIKIVTMWKQGLTIPVITKSFPNRRSGSVLTEINRLKQSHKIKRRMKKYKWSKEQDQLLVSLWNRGFSCCKMQRYTMISRHSIASVQFRIKRLLKAGIILHRSGPNVFWTPEDDALLIALRNQKKFVPFIAKQIKNHSNGNIRDRIRFLRKESLLSRYGEMTIPVPL
jgi:hypothetical protein